jgi:hypothetical protein
MLHVSVMQRVKYNNAVIINPPGINTAANFKIVLRPPLYSQSEEDFSKDKIANANVDRYNQKQAESIRSTNDINTITNKNEKQCHKISKRTDKQGPSNLKTIIPFPSFGNRFSKSGINFNRLSAMIQKESKLNALCT